MLCNHFSDFKQFEKGIGNVSSNASTASVCFGLYFIRIDNYLTSSWVVSIFSNELQQVSVETVPLEEMVKSVFKYIHYHKRLKPCDYLQKQPPEVFYKKAVLKNFAIFSEKARVGVSFSIKLQVFSPILKDIC